MLHVIVYNLDYYGESIHRLNSGNRPYNTFFLSFSYNVCWPEPFGQSLLLFDSLTQRLCVQGDLFFLGDEYDCNQSY